MADSSDNVFIDFNSPIKRDEFQTPLVPAPKPNSVDLLGNNQVDARFSHNNPFDFVIEQINHNNQNDPFELVYEEACKSIDQSLEVTSKMTNSSTTASSQVCDFKIKVAVEDTCTNQGKELITNEWKSHSTTSNSSLHSKLNINKNTIKTVDLIPDVVEGCNPHKELPEIIRFISSCETDPNNGKTNTSAFNLILSGKEKDILDESSSCIGNLSDSFLNSSSVADSAYLSHSQFNMNNLIDEASRVGELVEQELNRTFELIEKNTVSIERALSHQSECKSTTSPGTSSIAGKLKTPIKGDMKTVIADRIQKCIQKGLNDSRNSVLNSRNHRRSHSSSVLDQSFTNVKVPCTNSSVSNLNIEGTMSSSYMQMFESTLEDTPYRLQENYEIFKRRSNSLQNFSFSSPDTQLLERYQALKGGFRKSFDYGSDSKYAKFSTKGTRLMDRYRTMNVEFENGVKCNSDSTNLSLFEQGKACKSQIMGLRKSSSNLSHQEIILAAHESVNVGCKKNLELSSNSQKPASPLKLPNGFPHKAVSNSSRRASGLEDSCCKDEEDSVFLEARTLACVFSHKADCLNSPYQVDSSGDEEDFLCNEREVIPLHVPGSDSSDAEELEVPSRLSSSLQEKACPEDPGASQPSERLLAHRSFDGTLPNKEQNNKGKKPLRRWASNGSCNPISSMKSVPELSHENIRGLRLVTQPPSSIGSKKIVHLPVLVPPPPIPLVPLVGTRSKADARLKPIKPQPSAQPMKKGPMKAVIPIGNMMRNIDKKEQDHSTPHHLTGTSQARRLQPIKSQANTVKLAPMAQSTPDVNRKAGSMFQGSKMCSPIPHAVSTDTSTTTETRAMQRSSSSTSSIPSLTSPPLALRTLVTEHFLVHERSKSADNVVSSKLPALAERVQREKIQKRAKSANNLLQLKKCTPAKQLPAKGKKIPLLLSNPLKSLAKNSHISRILPSKRVAQAASHFKKSHVPASEKENVRPCQVVE